MKHVYSLFAGMILTILLLTLPSAAYADSLPAGTSSCPAYAPLEESYAVRKSEPVYTLDELLLYMDMSLPELAEALGISEEELLALSEEEIAEYHEILSNPISTYSGDDPTISLGVEFTGYVSTSSYRDYRIDISRSGRYLLYMDTPKYMSVYVYKVVEEGDEEVFEFVDGVGRFMNTNWCVDLEAGNTYSFEIQVDSRYSSGSANFSATLNLYIDGNYQNRATALAFDTYTPFEVKYYNDFQYFCFTAVEGSSYRFHSTGDMYRIFYLYDSALNQVAESQRNILGKHWFDLQLTPGKTYYLAVHGKDYYDSDSFWYQKGTGSVMVECLDSSAAPIEMTLSKDSVDPGFADSITFTVQSDYAQKVRVLADGRFIGEEHDLNNGRVVFSQSFHVSGQRAIQIQGYVNGSWSLLSAARTITVNDLPALGAVTYLPAYQNQVTAYANHDCLLEWYSLTDAVQYSAYVYSGEEQIYKVDTPNPEVYIPAEIFATPGLYYVDVYGLANRGQQSNPGARATVLVTSDPIPELGVVTYLYAYQRQITAYIGYDCWLEWNSLTNAVRYSAYVYSGKELIYTTQTSDTQVGIPAEIFSTPGLYYVDVYGLGSSGQQSSSGARATVLVTTMPESSFNVKFDMIPTSTVAKDNKVISEPWHTTVSFIPQWENTYRTPISSSASWINASWPFDHLGAISVSENKTGKPRSGWVTIYPDGYDPIFISVYQKAYVEFSEDAITLPDSLVEIQAEAFRNTDIEEIIIPANVESIGAYAFAGCTDLKYIFISNNVTYIAPTAFSGCNDLTFVCPYYNSAAREYATKYGYEYIIQSELDPY